MSNDGRIYRARGNDRLRAVNDVLANGDWSFRSLYTDAVNGVKGLGSVRSFSVHPRNLSVYLLKSGTLVRYSLCSGFPLDCSVDPDDAKLGRSDDGQTSVPAVQEFPVPAGVSQVFVDYTRQKVYLLSSDRGSILELKRKDGLALSALNKKVAVEDVDTTVSPVWDNQTLATAPVLDAPWMPSVRSTASSAPEVGWLNNRISGMTLDPSGSELTVADHSEQAWDAVGFQTTLYRVRDQFLSDPTGYLSAQVRAISQ
jgi:hypothetical protein